MKLIFLLTALSASPIFAEDHGFSWVSLIQQSSGTHFPEHTVTFLVVSLALIIISLLYRYRLSKLSEPIISDDKITFRNLVESFGQFVFNQSRSVLGDELAPKYYPLLMTIFILIFTMNLVGLIPGVLPPTQSMNTTLAMGVFVFVFYNVIGIKKCGFVPYIKHFMGPVWYMAVLIFPIEVISHCVRPLSLSLRLRGNIYGDHVMMAQFSDIIPYFVPIPFVFFGLFVSAVQAYVFMTLTMIYIKLALPENEH